MDEVKMEELKVVKMEVKMEVIKGSDKRTIVSQAQTVSGITIVHFNSRFNSIFNSRFNSEEISPFNSRFNSNFNSPFNS